MADLAKWDDLVNGRNCPLCLPRPNISETAYFVRKFGASSLYLSREQTYRGAVMLVYDLKHVARVDQLSASEWSDFAAEIQMAQAAIFRTFNPDHVNVECLGNMVPHLHFHVIPRYMTDDRWRGPIWMTNQSDMPSKVLDESAYIEMARAINNELDQSAKE